MKYKEELPTIIYSAEEDIPKVKDLFKPEGDEKKLNILQKLMHKEEVDKILGNDPFGNMTLQIQSLRKLGYKAIDESIYQKELNVRNKEIQKQQKQFDKELKAKLVEVISTGIDDNNEDPIEKAAKIDKKDLSKYDKYLDDVFKHKPDQEVKLDNDTNRDLPTIAKAARVVVQALLFPITKLVNYFAKKITYPVKHLDKEYNDAAKINSVLERDEHLKERFEECAGELARRHPDLSLGRILNYVAKNGTGESKEDAKESKEDAKKLIGEIDKKFIEQKTELYDKAIDRDDVKKLKADIANREVGGTSEKFYNKDALAKFDKMSVKEFLNYIASNKSSSVEHAKVASRIIKDIERAHIKELDKKQYVETVMLPNGKEGKYKIHKVNDPEGTVVHFHGNGEHIGEYTQERLDRLYRGYNVILMEYPGYSGTNGPTDRKNIEATTDQIYEHIIQKSPELIKAPVISAGHSVGGYYAARFANNTKECEGLILSNTYSSTTQTKGLEFLSGVQNTFSNEVLNTESVLKRMRPDVALVVSYSVRDNMFDPKKNGEKNLRSATSRYKTEAEHNERHEHINPESIMKMQELMTDRAKDKNKMVAQLKSGGSDVSSVNRGG